MQNLAGHKDADSIILDELARCGIEAIKGDPYRGEVKTSYTGALDGFTFTRAWYYWRVSGKMPLESAIRLYATPVGKKDIRVGGDCGCPDPSTFHGTRHYHPSGKKVLVRDEWEQERKSAEALGERWPAIKTDFYKDWTPSDNPAQYPGFVEAYHVDSELGLYLLANEIRKLQNKQQIDLTHERYALGWLC